MFRQDIEKQDHLIGETVPKWIVFGLLSLGVFASVSTAWMLLTSREPRDVQMFGSSPKQSDSSTPPSPAAFTKEPEPAVESGHTDRVMQEEPMPPTVAEMKESQTAVGIGENYAEPVPPVTPDTEVKSSPGVVEAKMAGKETGTSVLAGTVDMRDCPPLFTVMFERGGVRPLGLDFMDKIARLQGWLSAHPKAKIVIEGHASAVGPEELNLVLSHRRAKAIAKLILADAGIASTQIATRAFGDQFPLHGFQPKSHENQRASLRLEGANGCSAILTEEDNQ